MPKQRRLFNHFRVGLTHQLKQMLDTLIAPSGVSYQNWVTMAIIKEYEEKQGKRGRTSLAFINRGSEVPKQAGDLGFLQDGTPITQEMIDEDEKAHAIYDEEQEKLRRQYEQEENQKEENKNLKNIKYFRWCYNDQARRNTWAKIDIAKPNLIANYEAEEKQGKKIKVLYTKEQYQKALKEYEEIKQWRRKKLKEIQEQCSKIKSPTEREVQEIMLRTRYDLTREKIDEEK